MAQLLKGAAVATSLCEDLLPRINKLVQAHITPTLAVIRVGEDAGALSYERAAQKRADKLGCKLKVYAYDENVSQQQLIAQITKINEDSSIHGCLLFRPLPKTLNERLICNTLLPQKDVDGITQGSLYGVFAGQKVGFAPCTAQACMALLDYYGIDICGKHVCVIGRSLVIGRPVSMLAQHRNATVTMCHSKTKDLTKHLQAADIIIAALGHARFVTSNMVLEHQTLIDVGINWDASAQKLVGDVDFEHVEPKVCAITPVPGGIGSITTTILMQHVVEAAEIQRVLKA